jgi:hypothetical protein
LSIADWRKTFVEMEDLTEYAPAVALAGSWEEWQRFKKEWPAFNEILQEWKDELEVRLKSKSIMVIVQNAKDNVEAAKWVAEGKYKPKVAGRPTKAEIEHQKKVDAKVTTAVEDEIERVMSTQSNVTVSAGKPN